MSFFLIFKSAVFENGTQSEIEFTALEERIDGFQETARGGDLLPFGHIKLPHPWGGEAKSTFTNPWGGQTVPPKNEPLFSQQSNNVSHLFFCPTSRPVHTALKFWNIKKTRIYGPLQRIYSKKHLCFRHFLDFLPHKMRIQFFNNRNIPPFFPHPIIIPPK